ncbi:MAG: hypothetical protein FWD48_03500 [Oscillospiraceae bacterium]|nr:hypothetical protein [Oscillospiraceae bacterium]
MKNKIFALILIIALTLTLAACAEKPAQPMDTPHRIGTQGIIHASHIPLPNLNELIEKSDLIVDITITEWLGENIEHSRTFFSAEVNNTFKGEELDEIEIIQSGNSRITLECHPLFKIGDRVLVFLVEREWPNLISITKEEWDEIFKDRYETVSYLDVMDIWEYEDELYLLNRADFTPLAESILLSDEIEEANEEIKDEIIEQYLEYDPIFEYALYENVHENIFVLESVTDKIVRIVEENNN